MPSTMSAGYSSRCSSAVATGRISLSTNVRTVARISCWTSVSPSVCARRPMSVPFPEHGASGLLVGAGPLGDHDLAAEDAHEGAVLVVALGLDVDDAPVVLGLGLLLAQDDGLAVEGVAVEGRGHVAQRLDLQVGDGLAGDVRDGHAQQQ